jgi:hypothetical protein
MAANRGYRDNADPTLAEISDRMDRQHKLLNLIGLVALEA